ncbi:MAG: gluconate 2-dehydrogenase subunit 3 family protein [Saprospiraceae bacterium]
MKRRRAIKNIIIFSSAAAILPSCQFGPTMPVYENIPLDKKQWKFIGQFAEALLPMVDTNVTTPETTTDFVLTIFNDCHSPEDIQKYLTGLTELQTYVQQQYNRGFESLDAGQHAEIFSYLSGEEGPSESLKYFFNSTRQLALEHFTSSEFFLKNIMDWEFAPGRFLGCVTV